MQCGLFYQLPCAPEQQAGTCDQETMEQIIYAEELGFDIAWLAELHFYQPFSILSSPLILAAALAQRTRRIRLGTAVVLRPLQHPLRVAEDAATEVRQRMEAITWEEAKATMALYGSPEQCVQKLRDAHARCGMNQVICWFNPGGLVPHRQVLASMRRFAEEVMPTVRGL